MIDAALLPLQRSVLARPARWLTARGIRADQVTLAGFVIGALAVPALARAPSGSRWRSSFRTG